MKSRNLTFRNDKVASYQVINWFPKWAGWAQFKRLDPKQTDLALIYDWFLWIGFWEIRKWHNG
jgi:hypothetical protein